MAMIDFFKKNAFQKIDETEKHTEFGNLKITDSYGEEFDGLLVKTAIGEKTVGAKKGKESNTYNAFVPSNITLAKDDKLRYNYRDGRYLFIRLTSNAILNEERSGQTNWKTYTAESYEPAGELN